MNKIQFYDVHTHTNKQPMLLEVDNIVETCKDKHLIFNCVGTDVKDSLIACQQARKYKGIIYATVGMHPEDCNDIKDVDRIEQIYLKNKDVIVALGEVGLDYHQPNANKQKQKLFFHKFIDIANKYNLPLCVHVRNAEDDCLEILKKVKNQSKIWIHCFSSDLNIAKKYNKLGYMVSIPGIITFKNANLLNDAIKYLNPDKIMTETDGPWLAPIPVRGQTNYPFYVEYIANDIAKKLNIDKNKFAKNALKFFNIK